MCISIISILPLLKDIAIAMVTGIYAGIIVAKHSEFRSLREEASQILQKGLCAKDCANELSLISNSLNRLGHKKSANTLLKISKRYDDLSKSHQLINEDGQVELPSIEKAIGMIGKNNELRKEVNALSPSWLFTVLPVF